jgi:DNA-binding transcriptional MocR family regulator
MLTIITTSPFTERLIYLILVDGHHRKYLSRLRERLGETRRNVRAFEQIGLELFAEPGAGLFFWARFPYIDDSLALAEAAQRDDIMLAGHRLPPASRPLAVNRVQGCGLRGHPCAEPAAEAGVERGGVTGGEGANPT